MQDVTGQTRRLGGRRARWAVSLAVSLSLMTGAVGHGGDHHPSAPAFELVTFSGEAFTKESLKGQPALLVFWAPWCKVCREELPRLAEFYKTERPPRLAVLSIGFADLRRNVEAFVKANERTFAFPTGYDDDRWIARTFGVNATPTFLLLDGEGGIVLTHRGAGILRNGAFQTFVAGLRE